MSALPGKSDLAPKIAPRMAQVNVHSPIFSKDVSYPPISEGESSCGEITGVGGCAARQCRFFKNLHLRVHLSIYINLLQIIYIVFSRTIFYDFARAKTAH